MRALDAERSIAGKRTVCRRAHSAWVQNAAELKTVCLGRHPGLLAFSSSCQGTLGRRNSTDDMFRLTGWNGFSTGFASALMGVSMFFITIWAAIRPCARADFCVASADCHAIGCECHRDWHVARNFPGNDTRPRATVGFALRRPHVRLAHWWEACCPQP